MGDRQAKTERVLAALEEAHASASDSEDDDSGVDASTADWLFRTGW